MARGPLKDPEPIVEFRKYLRALKDGCPEAQTPMTEQARAQWLMRVHEVEMQITGMLAGQRELTRLFGAERRHLNKQGGDA